MNDKIENKQNQVKFFSYVRKWYFIIPSLALLIGYSYINLLLFYFSIDASNYFYISDYITISLNSMIILYSVFIGLVFLILIPIQRKLDSISSEKSKELQTKIIILCSMVLSIITMFLAVHYKSKFALASGSGMLFICIVGWILKNQEKIFKIVGLSIIFFVWIVIEITYMQASNIISGYGEIEVHFKNNESQTN